MAYLNAYIQLYTLTRIGKISRIWEECIGVSAIFNHFFEVIFSTGEIKFRKSCFASEFAIHRLRNILSWSLIRGSCL